MSSTLSNLSEDDDSTSSSLWVRAASLFVVVVIFQVLMAKFPKLEKSTKRRLQHALTGHALVQISYVLSKNLCLTLLLLGSAGIFICQKYFPSHFRQNFGPLLRPTELSGERLPGAFYFLLGTSITLILIEDMTIVRYAVETLAFADPIASWVGSSIPSPKINSGTSISGSVACFVSAWVVGFLMLEKIININKNNGENNIIHIATISIGAVACTIAEGLPFGDDNLNIPILTALAVQYIGCLL